MTIYKYLNPSRLNVLKSGCIRFTQPQVLNDPFEALPSLANSDNILHASLIGFEGRPYARQYYEYYVSLNAQNSIIDRTLLPFDFAFLSLSEVCENIIMWSHYCDSHKGFVIGFDGSSDFFKDRPGVVASGLNRVEYSAYRYVMPKRPPQGDAEYWKKQAIAHLFTKYKDWAYEQEVRFVITSDIADESRVLENGEHCYLMHFPNDIVQEVILGAFMSEENRRKIATIVQDQYPNAQLKAALLASESFALKIVSVDPRTILNPGKDYDIDGAPLVHPSELVPRRQRIV